MRGRHRRLVRPGLAALALLAALAAACAAPGWRRSLAAVAGERGLDNGSDFPGIDDQAHYGLALDWRREGRAWGFEAELAHSHDREDDLPGGGSARADVVEASFGVRRTFGGAEPAGARSLLPYVGGGLTWTHTDLRVTSMALGDTDEEDWDAGVYLHLGASWLVGGGVFVGLDYRRFFEDFFDYGGFDLDSDVLTLRVGFAF